MPATIAFIVAELLTAAWFFVMGACIGSFLNVVIYRLPRRITLLGQSLCPRCGTLISARDNIPIVSWMRLRGRCRHCDCPISSRYWRVELTVGLIVLALALVEIAAGGINLPIRPTHHWGFAFNLFGFRPELFVWMLVHATLLITLLATSVIDADGHQAPRRFVLGIFLVLIVAAAWFPESTAKATMYVGQVESVQRPVIYGLLATLVGICLGWAIANATSSAADAGRTEYFAVSLGLCGMALGVTPLLGITLFALPLAGRLGSAAIAVAAALHVFLWRSLHVVEFAGDPNRGTFVFILAAAGVTAAWAAVRGLLVTRTSRLASARAE